MKKTILVLAGMLVLGGCAPQNVSKQSLFRTLETVDYGVGTVEMHPELVSCFGLSREEAIKQLNDSFPQVLSDHKKTLPESIPADTMQSVGNAMDIDAIGGFVQRNRDTFIPGSLAYYDRQKCEAFKNKYPMIFFARK